MKKEIKKTQTNARVFFINMLTVFVLIRITLLILEKCFNLYILVENIRQEYIYSFIYVCILILIVFSLLSIVRKKKFKILIVISSCLIFLWFIFNYIWLGYSYSSPKYFHFKSPDNKIVLLVEEESWLFSGWSNLYIRVNSFFVKDIEQKITVDTDDGYRPFSEGDYKLTWIDNDTVKLTYGFGSDNIVKTETIKLK